MGVRSAATKLHIPPTAACGCPTFLPFVAVFLLCSASYLLGVWQHGGFASPSEETRAAVSVSSASASAVACTTTKTAASATATSRKRIRSRASSGSGSLDFSARAGAGAVMAGNGARAAMAGRCERTTTRLGDDGAHQRRMEEDAYLLHAPRKL